MDEQQLAEIEARALWATLGEWEVTTRPGHVYVLDEGRRVIAELNGPAAEAELNASFIVAARQDIPALCSALREAWAENKHLKDVAVKAFHLADITLYYYDSEGGRWDNPHSSDNSKVLASWIMGSVEQAEPQEGQEHE